jgi:hypothetical protein
MIIIHCLQVESLTAARKSALNGQEPSDAIRQNAQNGGKKE